MAFQLPHFVVSFYAKFPLYSYPPIPPPFKKPIQAPTLWIAPPNHPNLSADVECLKWQAYLAFRNVSGVKLRWDVAPEGSLDCRLPNLHVPMKDSLETESVKRSEGAEDGELFAAHMIPAWVDHRLGVDSSADVLEGYKDEAAKDESRAWVSLLEGTVHAALIISQPQPSYFHSLIYGSPESLSVSNPSSNPLSVLLIPPPASLTGLFSLFPPSGTRVSTSTVLAQYQEAIASLSERLGTDRWFLGSSEPTPLDALAFAYVHGLLNGSDEVRIEVTRRVNLVAWELRVRNLVQSAFKQ